MFYFISSSMFLFKSYLNIFYFIIHASFLILKHILFHRLCFFLNETQMFPSCGKSFIEKFIE